MASPHGTTGSSHFLAHDDVPETMDGDDISIRTTEEMENCESLHRREFAHTCINDVNFFERVGLDKELPTILLTIDWGKLYDEPCLGSRLLTLEFLMTFQTIEKNGKSFVKFHLFRKSFGCDFSRFSELLDLPKSCLPESSTMRNFNKVEFGDAISGKSARLMFSDIYNPSLRFLYRWMLFMLIPTVELRSVTTPELKYLFAMVNRIKYTLVADIVEHIPVVEMDVCSQTSLILGRPFLSTAGATIDVAAGIIKLNISGKEETFTFKPKGTEQCNQVMVMIRLEQKL
jgi:hypothetical protein